MFWSVGVWQVRWVALVFGNVCSGVEGQAGYVVSWYVLAGGVS